MKPKQAKAQQDPESVGKVTGLPKWWEDLIIGWSPNTAPRLPLAPPRIKSDYKEISVTDLYVRIHRDLAELLGRVCPSVTNRKNSETGLDEPLSYATRLRSSLNKGIADDLSSDLWERIFSPIQDTRENAREEYKRGLEKLLEEEPRSSAEKLAHFTIGAATWLENLYAKQPDLMKEIAKECDLWPVNLGLKSKRRNGKVKYELKRISFAHRYLEGLELNSKCFHHSGHQSGLEDVSPFTLAAENLYRIIMLLRRKPGWFPPETEWAKQIFALSVPMTKQNASKWWKAIKVFLEERWKTTPKDFSPLIVHLGLHQSKKPLYPSEIKRRVVDNDLKDAFLALARQDL
jgi:hypothetical protein